MKTTIKLEERRSGKTTGNFLKALGEAIANPGENILYIDHAVDCGAGKFGVQKSCKEKLEEWIKLLNLDVNVCLCSNNNIYIKSNWSPIFVGDDGNSYKKIS